MRQRPGLKVTVISLPGLNDLVSSQGFNVGIQSNIWSVFHASKTWLQARVLMLGYCTTVISLPCIKDRTIKDLVSSQAFNIGIQSNIWTVFHATNTWLQARVLIMWYYTTVTSLPCFKDLVSSQGFNVGIQSNIWTVFHATKTWLQVRVLMLWYCTTVTSLPCLKDLVSSQGFNVGIQSNIWTVFLYQRPSFKPGLWC